MYKTRIFRSILLTLALVSPAFGAAAKRITVQVEGMACPFCAYNIEKRIKTLDAVPDEPNYEASVDKGEVGFDWKATEPVDKPAIREQIKKAGFTPGAIEVQNQADSEDQAKKKENKQKTVAGTAKLTADEDQMQVRLVPNESETTLTLVAADRVDRRISFKALKQYLGKKKKDAGQAVSASVTVQGASTDGNSKQFRLHSWQPTLFKTLVMLHIDKLLCQQCAAGVIKKIGKLDNVVHVEADFEKDRARVWSGVAEPDTDAIRQAVEQAGFEVTHLHTLTAKEARQAEKK